MGSRVQKSKKVNKPKRRTDRRKNHTVYDLEWAHQQNNVAGSNNIGGPSVLRQEERLCLLDKVERWS